MQMHLNETPRLYHKFYERVQRVCGILSRPNAHTTSVPLKDDARGKPVNRPCPVYLSVARPFQARVQSVARPFLVRVLTISCP